MHTSWPTNHYVTEQQIGISNSLHDNAVITFSIDIINLALMSSTNGNMCTIYRTRTHWRPPFLLVTLDNMNKVLSSWKQLLLTTTVL